ncbi:MAG: type III-A CRISPR-associated protein Csm2 [Deltaproteobacteria bacterium HGW-Deltaproteobacteria-15]|jgi:CRISPR-associated protein Csm2|nr:MAG: type III-A CRISPR-associated protein Csm2 [Deltaproteobacteria bacterium HGW-Deltaproteobacteria-15]
MSYRDEKGAIKIQLLDQDAKSIAEGFAVKDPNKPGRFLRDKSLTSAQLRRFFGEFRQLQKKVESKGFDRVLPMIKMVKSKASYAANPRSRKIPDSFRDFLSRNVDLINELPDFEAFMLHFEAVVGFYYGMGISND